MFNRAKDQTPPDHPADADDTTEIVAAEASHRSATLEGGPDIESLLRVLDQTGRTRDDVSSTALQRVADQAGEHADVLSAASNAQKEAHLLLSLARNERDHASGVASQLIEEARQAAARLKGEAEVYAEAAREQTRREAADQRVRIDAVITELTEAASHDAARIRAEALDSAMGDARLAARRYVSRAAALGARDAERHRAEVAETLEGAARAVQAAHTTMQDFASNLSAFATGMGAHLETLRTLTERTAAQRETAGSLEPISVDERSWAAAGLADVHDDDLIDLPVSFGEAESPDTAETRYHDELDGDESGGNEHISRPLGSMFRDPEQA